MAGEAILVVDDNPANQKLMRVALNSAGFDVRTASDSEEALKAIRLASPRLILLDLQLPGIDGFELTRRLKGDPSTREILILAVTAYAMKGDRERALAAGCDGYISKPIDPMELPKQIARMLTGSELELMPRPARGPSILAIEDNPTTRKMIRVALETEGYRVIEAASGREGICLAGQERPDLILQDLILPDMDGLEVLRQLREQSSNGLRPVIAVSGFVSRLEQARVAEGAFTAVMVKPVDPLQLLDLVRHHLRGKPAEAEQLGKDRLVLLVNDDPIGLKLGRVHLSTLGFRVATASGGAEALEMARELRPKAVVTDVLMPGMDGFELCLAIRRDPLLESTPVVLMSARYVQDEDRELAKNAGASALVTQSAGYEAIAKEVVRAFEATVPRPVDTEAVEREHGRRAIWQLEAQVRLNAGLLQRCSYQAAQLSVLAGIADALSRNADTSSTLRDVLAACLDAAGISNGALYLRNSAGRLALEQSIGYGPGSAGSAADFFGAPRLLERIAEARVAVVLPSPGHDSEETRRFLAASGTSVAMVAPLVRTDQLYGCLLLGTSSAQVTSEELLAFARTLGAQIAHAIALASAFERLARSEQRTRGLMEQARDAILVLDSDGRLLSVNRQGEVLLGQPASAAVGRSLLDLVGPSDTVHARALFRTLASRGTAFTADLGLTRPDGNEARVEASLAVAGDSTIAILRDITQAKAIEMQLLQSEKLATVGMLAAGIAHEVNNPVSFVLANLDFMKDMVEKAVPQAAKDSSSLLDLETMRSMLGQCLQGAERIRRIVKELNRFSRLDTPDEEDVDINRVVESSLNLASHETRYRAIVEMDLAPNLPLLRANPGRLGQVLVNLAVNAAQAIESGAIDQNSIRVSTRAENGHIRIAVADTGRGIAPEAMGRIFEPFFTTKPPGVGTGLGLPICRGIVEQYGGRLDVESRPGRGTVFSVLLPIPSFRHEETAEPPPAVEEPDVSGFARILLVDDETILLEIMERILGSRHQVMSAPGGEEALEILRQQSGAFDVVFCDIMMPRVDGPELHHRVKDLYPGLDQRFIFMTGGAPTSRAQQFLATVPNPRVFKPFSIKDLLQALTHLQDYLRTQ